MAIRFDDVSDGMRLVLMEHAFRTGERLETVHGWWKEYCRDCVEFGQKPLLVEFEQWYADRLGLPVPA